uniref:Uncharacterized protein n=1 Tax=Rhizophora mucronata TaxID=61149 RepID=A0A2P2PPK0_RHIMU
MCAEFLIQDIKIYGRQRNEGNKNPCCWSVSRECVAYLLG